MVNRHQGLIVCLFVVFDQAQLDICEHVIEGFVDSIRPVIPGIRDGVQLYRLLGWFIFVFSVGQIYRIQSNIKNPYFREAASTLIDAAR